MAGENHLKPERFRRRTHAGRATADGTIAAIVQETRE